MLTLFYLTLQSTREGQAAHAHVHEIVKGLRARGWQVLLFEPRYSQKQFTPSPIRRICEFITVQYKLWKRIFRSRPSALYIRWHFAAWTTVLLARLLKIPVIQEVNGPYGDLFAAWPWTRYFRALFVLLLRSQLLRADAVVTVTPQLGEWVKKEGVKKPVAVIPNGANTELFHPDGPCDPLVEHHKPYVVFFGALAPWQGIEVMLEAIDNPAWPQEVKMVIIGDGVLRSKVEEFAEKNSKVVFLGLQPYNRMPGLIRGSLAVLVPKTDDRSGHQATGLFPLKLFEGMACSIPVIVTDFPGMAELVRKEKCGLVIPPGNPQALAEAVRYLYEHPEVRTRMGARGRKVVLQNHSWDARAAETGRFLKKIIGGSGS